MIRKNMWTQIDSWLENQYLVTRVLLVGTVKPENGKIKVLSYSAKKQLIAQRCKITALLYWYSL